MTNAWPHPEYSCLRDRGATSFSSHENHFNWNGCELCHPEIFPTAQKDTIRFSTFLMSNADIAVLAMESSLPRSRTAKDVTHAGRSGSITGPEAGCNLIKPVGLSESASSWPSA